MNRAQLKKALKPLVKELLKEGLREDNKFIRQCIREVIFEDGTISKLISETARGLSANPVLSEQAPKQKRKRSAPTERPASSFLGELTPETTIEEDEAQAKLEEERIRRMKESVEQDKRELLAHREQKRKTMERMLGSTGIPMEIFNSVDTKSIPLERAPRSLKEAGGSVLPANFKGKGDGNQAMPLRHLDPSDPGVNITGILKLVGGSGTWKSQINE